MGVTGVVGGLCPASAAATAVAVDPDALGRMVRLAPVVLWLWVFGVHLP